MIRIAAQELAASIFSDKLAITRRDFSSHGHDLRPAFDGATFEGVVIEIHLMGLRRDRAAVTRVINDEVRIAA